MTFLLASAREEVARYVNTLIFVYTILIIIRVIMSFIPSIPYYRWLDAVLTFVRDVTDPYLNLFRRFIPPVRLGPAALDLTPMIAIFVLAILGRILVRLIAG